MKRKELRRLREGEGRKEALERLERRWNEALEKGKEYNDENPILSMDL